MAVCFNLCFLQSTGNQQWDSKYPAHSDFLADVEKSVLWVVAAPLTEGQEDIAGVVAITTDQYEQYVEVGWDLNEECIVPHRVAVNLNHRGKGVGNRQHHRCALCTLFISQQSL